MLTGLVLLSIGTLATVDQSLPPLIPWPTTFEPMEGSALWSGSVRVHADSGLHREAELAKSLVKPFAKGSGAPEVRLDLDPGLAALGPEGYRLTIGPKVVVVAAQTPAGVFHGIQTLRQMLPPSAEREHGIAPASLAACRIEDRPRFAWRGAMLDPCRHFLPKEFIYKFLDLMALHKLNSLHLHLTDDQGWRIEIKRYPKLTEVGAWRKETVIGRNTGKFDGVRHGGFYTQEDLRSLVKYAKERYIEIVPEIEMPGHAQAAIASYPELGNGGKQLEVLTQWGVSDNVYNVKDSTLAFLKGVIDEVLQVFPSKFIHLGGDECPKTQWKASAEAQAKIKSLQLKDEHELQSWFVRQMDAYLASKGRRLIGWDEILEGGLAPGATVMSWRGEQGGVDAALANHDVVMAPTGYTYFDYYQSKNQDNEPLAIGGYVPLAKVYGWEPVPPALRGKPEASHVLGGQCQLWSEYLPNSAQVEYMAFPRLCALAESLWSAQQVRSWDRFSSILPFHLDRLSQLGVNFHRLEPGSAAPAATWSSGQVSERYQPHSWDVSRFVDSNGRYEVRFDYTGGDHRLDIESVMLVQGGSVLGTDAHPGFTGGMVRRNVYVVKVSEFKAGLPVALVASIRADGGTDSNGEITIRRLPQN